MGYKRPPTEDELNALADQFRALWTPGTPIRTWLRKHAAQIQAARGEWSWAAIAAALDRAGIGYQPRVRANPAARDPEWSPDTLKQEFSRARKPLKGYVRKKEPAPKIEPQPEPKRSGVDEFVKRAAEVQREALAPASARLVNVDLTPLEKRLLDVREGLEVLGAEVRMLARRTAVAAPQAAPVIEYRYLDPPPVTVTATVSAATEQKLESLHKMVLDLQSDKTRSEIQTQKQARKKAWQNAGFAAFVGLIVGAVVGSYISLNVLLKL